MSLSWSGLIKPYYFGPILISCPSPFKEYNCQESELASLNWTAFFSQF